MKITVVTVFICLAPASALAFDSSVMVNASKSKAIQIVAKFLRGGKEKITGIYCNGKECLVYKENLK